MVNLVDATVAGPHVQRRGVHASPADAEIIRERFHRSVEVGDDDADVVEVRIDHGGHPPTGFSFYTTLLTLALAMVASHVLGSVRTTCANSSVLSEIRKTVRGHARRGPWRLG